MSSYVGAYHHPTGAALCNSTGGRWKSQCEKIGKKVKGQNVAQVENAEKNYGANLVEQRQFHPSRWKVKVHVSRSKVKWRPLVDKSCTGGAI